MGFISREALDHAITGQILKLQGALQDANKNLELRVQERTNELEVAYKKLSELTELKSNFISNISHELRTPLTHIQGYVDLFLNGDGYTVDEEMKQGLLVMQRAAERLNNLISDLIMFSTTETGTLKLRKQIFNVKETAARCVSQYEPIAEQKKISLKLSCQPEQVEVFADEDRITWVIKQLLDNAIKYSHQNGLVTLKLDQENEEVVICVEDNGIGFEASKIEEIFEPFHQLDGSLKRHQGGTGIGLALAKRIVEAHKSKISTWSEVDKGTKFEFRLPIAQK
jgi:two-component system sensor histidine kinase ResE